MSVLALQELDIAHRRAVYGALDDHPDFVAVRAVVHLPGAAVARDGDDALHHGVAGGARPAQDVPRSEEHTSELQSLMRTSYAVLCLTKNNNSNTNCSSSTI